jgi:prophage regulatory protein
MESGEMLLRIKDVEQRIGLRRSKIYGLIRDGDFPPPLKLGRRTSAWVASEIDSWVRRQVDANPTRRWPRGGASVTKPLTP